MSTNRLGLATPFYVNVPVVVLGRNILATLAYYDVFDFPLKAGEIFRCLFSFKHLGLPPEPLPSLSAVEEELEQMRKEKKAGFADGFYFLFNREYLTPLRLRREKIAKKKWEKVFHAAWWLKFLPYIKAVFASGSLAMSNTEELGDLDVLIIVSQGRIWLSRLLVSGLMSLIGMRRKYNQKIAPDKICLNHYITDESLLIPHESVYTAQSYVNLKPVFISNPGIAGEFYKANSWLSEYVLSFGPGLKRDDAAGSHREKVLRRDFLARFKVAVWKAILDTGIGDLLEQWAKRWQTKRIEKHRKQDPPGGRVVYNDDCLEFHPGSVEKEIIDKYNQRLEKLGLAELAIEKDSGA